MAIKKEVIAYKVVLNVFIYRDNKDEKMLDTIKPNKNKNIFFHSNFAIFALNQVFINENNSNLNAKQHTYKTTLITFNYD